MSDAPQGPGWWQASDDKWYPPPRPEMPGEEATGAVTSGPSGGYEQPAPAPYGTAMPSPPVGAPGAPVAPGAPGSPMVPGAPGAPVAPAGMPGGPPSPYGAMPPAPPIGAGQNRTPLFVALGVLVTVVLVALLIVATSGGDDGGGETTGTSTTAATTPGDGPLTPPAPGGDPAPPSDGEIALVEQGFSVSFDQLSEVDMLAYGFVVENTTDQVATTITAQVGFLDESGTVIATDNETLNVLMPGQTFGMGDSGIEVDGEPVEMQVTLAEPTWEATDGYGEITASGISTSIDDYGAPTASFTAESTYGEQLDSPYAYAVFRNSSGDIVGGAWSSMSFIQANGASTGEVASFYTIDDIDEDQTEVYVDPGFI